MFGSSVHVVVQHITLSGDRSDKRRRTKKTISCRLRNSAVPEHVIWTMANAQQENNDTYRLHRAKPDSPVAVSNQDGFFMAEYNPATGATAWHRVVPATKRESVEKRLAQQFPAIVEMKVAANKPGSKSRKS